MFDLLFVVSRMKMMFVVLLVVLCCSLSANTGNLCFSRGGLFSNFAECIRRFELDDGERRINQDQYSWMIQQTDTKQGNNQLN